MAQKRELLTYPFLPGAAVSACRFVKLSAESTVIQMAAATDLPAVGASFAAAASTDPVVEVVTHGVAKVECGAAVTFGDQLTSDGTGRAVTAVATNLVCGRALESAAGAGVFIPVLLGPFHIF